MKTVKSIIDAYALSQPDQVFMLCPETGKTMTYAELKSTAEEVGHYLSQLGVEKGEKVAFLLPNGYWSVALLLGVIYSGRIIVPLNAVSGDSALSYVIDHSGCSVILVDADSRDRFKKVLADLPDTVSIIDTDIDNGPQWGVILTVKESDPEVKSKDVAILMYTSGTTGKPKGVLLTHANAVAGGENTAVAHELSADDRALCVLPLYHINAQMVTIMAPLVKGGSVVMPKKFSTSIFWNLIADFECSWFSVVPTIIAYLLEYAEREGFNKDELGGLPNLRFGRSASAPLAPEMHREFEERFGVPIIETMGLTETAAQILSNPMPPAKPKYGSPGIAIGNEARIVDEAGNECPRGVAGELMIRGANVTPGYYNNPQATAEALEEDGWFHTGDVALQDNDGFFFITGRIKELIIKGGENIAPREIDEALYEHPAVLEAAGFGVPDDRYGQEVMACVALKMGCGCDEEELSLLLQSKLGGFKSPRRIYFLDELPKGPSGKIQRLKLPELVRHLM